MTPIPKTTKNPYEATDVPAVDGPVSSYVRFGISFRLAIVLTGGLFPAVLFTRNHFRQFFDNFGVELPAATQVALHPGTLVFVGVPFLVTLSKEFLDPPGALMRTANIIACLAALIIGLVYAIAMYMPVIRITTDLS